MKLEFERPVRYLISPGDASVANFLSDKKVFLHTVQLAVEVGISLIQIREKHITTKQLIEVASAAAEITANSNTKLLINGRADVAHSAQADGVHLPEDGLPVAVVRNAFPALIIGCSVHTVESAQEAKDADFLLFGPIFDSGEKRGVGLEELSEVTVAVGQTPVLAVGGVDGDNFHSVLEAGAAGFAAIRYLNDHAALEKLR